MKVQLSNEKLQILLNSYDEGYSLKVSGQKVGISPDVAKRILKENGRTIRPYATKVTDNGNREKVKNKTFFSKENENPDMAWLLGFLAADGTVRQKNNNIKIGLSSKDEEILFKIKNLLELTNSSVTHYETNKGYDVSELAWTCKQHKIDLARYGIVPNKTFCLKPPYDLDEKYYKDYIRGYFDGDGSISINSGKYLRFSIVSGTKEILEFIINVFYDNGIEKVKIMEDNRHLHTNYYFSYANEDSIKIYDFLYYDNCLCLNRKKEKFDKIILRI